MECACFPDCSWSLNVSLMLTIYFSHQHTFACRYNLSLTSVSLYIIYIFSWLFKAFECLSWMLIQFDWQSNPVFSTLTILWIDFAKPFFLLHWIEWIMWFICIVLKLGASSPYCIFLVVFVLDIWFFISFFNRNFIF